jgi:hypothetical protein
MGLFDDDPKYQALKALRESGYDGPIDQDGQPTDRHADVLDALRRTGGR